MSYVDYLRIPYKFMGRGWDGCDCFGLLKLFYKKEFNIELPDDTEYPEQWFKEDAQRIIKSYRKFGFELTETAQYGDILLLNASKYPKHLGIVVNNGYFLHTTNQGTFCHNYEMEYHSDIHSIYRFQGIQ